MSDYLLYGTKLIENDSTMRDFAISVIKNISTDDLKEEEKRYNEELEDTDYEDIFMDRVHDSLQDDISRTDINYEELMCKYSSEIGDLLCDIENHGMDLSTIKLSFFGDNAKTAFNKLVEELVWFIKFQ